MTLGPAKSHNAAGGPDRATSPAGSFYAMSDDDEGEYNTITHTETGRGVKLLYSKSKVRPAGFGCQVPALSSSSP